MRLFFDCIFFILSSSSPNIRSTIGLVFGGYSWCFNGNKVHLLENTFLLIYGILKLIYIRLLPVIV